MNPGILKTEMGRAKRNSAQTKRLQKKPGREKFRILLLEGIHSAAEESFRNSGFRLIEKLASSPDETQLLEMIPHVHILGIRSKTKITARVLEAAAELLAVGCFCIGTDQVDLEAATRRGVAVFNAPFSNTRSVAELTIAEVVMLARRAAVDGITWRPLGKIG